MPLNKVYVNFFEMKNLAFLLSKDESKRRLKEIINKAVVIDSNQAVEVLKAPKKEEETNFVVYYSSLSQYEFIAHQLGIISDNKAGIPRGKKNKQR